MQAPEDGNHAGPASRPRGGCLDVRHARLLAQGQPPTAFAMSGDIRSGCREPADPQLHSGASLKCKIRTDIASVISPLPESGCVSSGRNAGVQIADSGALDRDESNDDASVFCECGRRSPIVPFAVRRRWSRGPWGWCKRDLSRRSAVSLAARPGDRSVRPPWEVGKPLAWLPATSDEEA